MSLVAVYKALQATFGMDSLTPYAVVSTLVFIASVVLLFIWMRRRVGDWLALAGALPLLFLGAAYEDLLSPFQLGYFAPIACGIGALLALERGNRRGDVVCCALLVFAISFQTVGLVFVAAAAVAIAWIASCAPAPGSSSLPAALYALWYLGWGRSSDASQLSFENIATAPGFILDGYAARSRRCSGSRSSSADAAVRSLDWGRPLLALAIVVGAAVLIARGRIPKWLVVVVIAGLAFWFLTAINASTGRLATTSRYQYIGVVFVLMTAAELARGVRPELAGDRDRCRRLARGDSREPVGDARRLPRPEGCRADRARRPRGARDRRRQRRSGARPRPRRTRTSTTSRSSTPAPICPPPTNSARRRTRRRSSPARPKRGRAAADKVLAAADGVALRPVDEAAGCRPAAAGAPALTQLEPGSTTVVRASGATAELALRRYATESFPVELGSLAAGEAAALELPADASAERWELAATGGALELCESSKSDLR